MVRLEIETLEQYLKTYGWEFHPCAGDAFVTGWQGDKRAYPLKIELAETWIRLQVRPFMRLGMDWEGWPEFTKFLLELNHDCQLVKLAIDEFGELTLSLQVFNSGFSYEQFSHAIGVIGYYAEELYDQLLERLREIGYLEEFESRHNLA